MEKAYRVKLISVDTESNKLIAYHTSLGAFTHLENDLELIDQHILDGDLEPSVENKAGLYSVRPSNVRELQNYSYIGLDTATVCFAGRPYGLVVEHELGYRSECYRVDSMVALSYSETLLRRLSRLSEFCSVRGFLIRARLFEGLLDPLQWGIKEFEIARKRLLGTGYDDFDAAARVSSALRARIEQIDANMATALEVAIERVCAFNIGVLEYVEL